VFLTIHDYSLTAPNYLIQNYSDQNYE